MDKQILMPIGISAFAIAIAVIMYLLGSSFIRNQAIDACMKNSKIETVIKQGDQTQTVIQPNGAWYGTCLNDKGIK